jgi:hypothetical protein
MEIVYSFGKSGQPGSSSYFYLCSNKNLRKVQTMIGVYLHTTSVPIQVITLLSQYGLSVDCKSLEHIMESLAKHQKERLRASRDIMQVMWLSLASIVEKGHLFPFISIQLLYLLFAQPGQWKLEQRRLLHPSSDVRAQSDCGSAFASES